jgi:hypothetical protein
MEDKTPVPKDLFNENIYYWMAITYTYVDL